MTTVLSLFQPFLRFYVFREVFKERVERLVVSTLLEILHKTYMLCGVATQS